MRHHLGAHVGFRGSDLLLWAAVWCVVGWRVLVGYDEDPAHRVPLEALSNETRAAVWFGAAAVAVAAAFRKPPADGIGFRALVIPAALRALSYTAATFWGLLPGEQEIGWAGAWPLALTWTAITLIVVRQAYRPEFPVPGLKGDSWTQEKL